MIRSSINVWRRVLTSKTATFHYLRNFLNRKLNFKIKSFPLNEKLHRTPISCFFPGPKTTQNNSKIFFCWPYRDVFNIDRDCKKSILGLHNIDIQFIFSKTTGWISSIKQSKQLPASFERNMLDSINEGCFLFSGNLLINLIEVQTVMIFFDIRFQFFSKSSGYTSSIKISIDTFPLANNVSEKPYLRISFLHGSFVNPNAQKSSKNFALA